MVSFYCDARPGHLMVHMCVAVTSPSLIHSHSGSIVPGNLFKMFLCSSNDNIIVNSGGH